MTTRRAESILPTAPFGLTPAFRLTMKKRDKLSSEEIRKLVEEFGQLLPLTFWIPVTTEGTQYSLVELVSASPWYPTLYDALKMAGEGVSGHLKVVVDSFEPVNPSHKFKAH